MAILFDDPSEEELRWLKSQLWDGDFEATDQDAMN
jgi:hypothetical protein